MNYDNHWLDIVLKRYDIDRKELCFLMGITESNLRFLLSSYARNTKLSTYKNIAKSLNISLSELFSDNESYLYYSSASEHRKHTSNN